MRGLRRKEIMVLDPTVAAAAGKSDKRNSRGCIRSGSDRLDHLITNCGLPLKSPQQRWHPVGAVPEHRLGWAIAQQPEQGVDYHVGGSDSRNDFEQRRHFVVLIDTVWWQPNSFLPALVIIGPYFFNKLIYIYFPDYLVFVGTDYACRIFSLALLYLLLSRKPTSLPIPWRLAASSTKELLMALIGTIILIGSNVVGMTFIRYLNAHSWRLTRFPLPTNSALQYFDNTVGMVFVGLSEEVVFRFYLMNLLLLRGMSPTMTIILSTLIFGGFTGRTVPVLWSLPHSPVWYFR